MSLFVDVYCYPNGSSVSVDPGGRLHVGNKYIWVSFHPYCGPSFYHGDNVFEPANKAEEAELWEEFGRWHKKFSDHEQKLTAKGKTIYRAIKAK